MFWFSAQERQPQCVYMEIANKTQVKATPTVVSQVDQCRITPNILQSTTNWKQFEVDTTYNCWADELPGNLAS